MGNIFKLNRSSITDPFGPNDCQEKHSDVSGRTFTTVKLHLIICILVTLCSILSVCSGGFQMRLSCSLQCYGDSFGTQGSHKVTISGTDAEGS